jgi:hypothetical protein
LRLLAAVAAFAAAASFSGGRADSSPRFSSVISDEWYIIEIGGNRAGSLRQITGTAAFNGREVLLSRQEVRTVFLRDGLPLQNLTVIETMSETDDLRPVGFNQVELDGNDKKTASGSARGDGTFHFDLKIGGRVSSRDAALPPGAIFSTLVDLKTRRNLKDGAVFEAHVIMEGDGDIAKARVAVTAGARDARCGNAVFTTVTQVAGLESIEWRDDSGRPLCIAVPSIKALFRLSNESQAGEPFGAFDIYEGSQIRPDRPIPDPGRLLTLTVKISSPGPSPEILTDPRQQVVARDATSLTVKTSKFAEKPPAKGPFDAPELMQYLQPTEYEQSDSPEISARAGELAWGSADGLETAKRIVKWVHGHISKPSMRRGYLSALDVLRQGEGDCTEYAVLSAALARATGLPARLAGGVTYVDGAFGFHQWVEIWVGYWYPFDPTIAGGRVDPTHIKVWNGRGDPGGLREASIAVMKLFGNVKISVLEMKHEQ